MLMAGLLFVAFAFFAVAQAGAVRNGGRSAADAAALAAARADRDALYDGLLDALGDDGWEEWLEGTAPLPADGCEEAGRFAGRNRADVRGCEPVSRGPDRGYTVGVETRFDTGRTFVPGTSDRTARASATAVVRPRCTVEDDTDDIELTCDGEDFTLDPDDDETGAEPRDLFTVALVGA